jgi:hypothetical protein
MRRLVALLAAALLAGGCLSTIDTRPVYQPAATMTDGDRVLVVGVERDPANRYLTDTLARELAFALSQRGRAAVELSAFAAALATAGRPLPEEVLHRLAAGSLDRDLGDRLRTEHGVRLMIVLQVELYEQVWGSSGKRTRVGLSARGRDLTDGEGTWRAFATPDVEDEPGRGFQLATEAALGALVRVISGEREPTPVPRLLLPALKVKW